MKVESSPESRATFEKHRQYFEPHPSSPKRKEGDRQILDALQLESPRCASGFPLQEKKTVAVKDKPEHKLPMAPFEETPKGSKEGRRLVDVLDLDVKPSPRSTSDFPRQTVKGSTKSSPEHILPPAPFDEKDYDKTRKHVFYKRMLRYGVPQAAVHYRMHLDGAIDSINQKHVMNHVFGTDHEQVDTSYTSKQHGRMGMNLHPTQSSTIGTAASSSNDAVPIQKFLEIPSEPVKGGKTGRLELIDLTRAGEISVALRAFKDMTMAQLAEAIDCVEQIHGYHRILLMDKILPTEAERNIIRGYCGRIKDLAPCSRWLMQILNVPDYEAKVRVIQTMELFPKEADRMTEFFRLVTRTSDQIMDSAALKEILAFVLRLGSVFKKEDCHPNAHHKGPHSHFNVEALTHVSHTRCCNMSVMEFVVRCIETKKPKLLKELALDFSEADEASQVKLNELVKDMNVLYESLEVCKKQLHAMKNDELVTTQWVEDTSPHLSRGIRRLERFMAYAAIRFSKLEVDRDLALVACRKLSNYCDVEDETAGIKVVNDFVKIVQETSAEIKKKATTKKEKVQSIAHEMLVQAITFGPSVQQHDIEVDVDSSHLRRVKSMVDLYNKAIELLNNPDLVPKPKTPKAMIDINEEISETSSTHVEDGSIQEERIHHVNSVVRMYEDMDKSNRIVK